MNRIISSFAQNFKDNPAEKCPNDCNCSKNCSICLRRQYYNKTIDYSCNNLRMMYVLRYLYVHSSEMHSLFKDNAKLIFSHLDSNDLVIRSIGAGPGLELIGFLRFIHVKYKKYKIKKITLQRVEREEGWNEIYNKCWDIYTQNHSISDDLKIRRRRINKNVFENCYFDNNCNILIFSYFWSEHLTNSRCLTLWKKLSLGLKGKSIIILNDRPEAKVTKLFDTFERNISDTIVNSVQRDLLQQHCGLQYNDTLKEKFGPKLNCNCHQRILLLEN